MKKYNTHLKVGDQAPLIDAIDQSGLSIGSEMLLELGKLVLIFYRGAWCPHCNRHIRQVKSELLSLLSKGAQVLLITPEQPPFLREVFKETQLPFPVIVDHDYKIMKDFGVVFEVDESNFKDFFMKESMIEVIKKRNESTGNLYLPIPATFLIDQNNTIAHIHFRANFKKRMSVSEIIDKL